MVGCYHDPVGKANVLFDFAVDMQQGGLLLQNALAPVRVCHSINDLQGLDLSGKNLIVAAHSDPTGGEEAFR